MQKIQLIVLFILIFVVTFFVFKGFLAFPLSASPVVPAFQSQKQEIPSPSLLVEEVIELPTKLLIPSLKVEAEVESVGMDQKGRMDVPQEVMNVAWYNLGFKPGQRGNAVFAGHFDQPDGSPAVFNALKSMKKGDLIEVVDVGGKTKQFQVTEVRVVELNEFPLQEVFGEGDKKMLNLITCGGEWDKQKKEYSERTIVFSEEVEPSP